ncbi:hypothetical protein EON65_02565 [archaeon]|nr:MAG: hypothetical protein EON65_02565 [archaeon]
MSSEIKVQRPKLEKLRRGFYNEPYLTCTYCNQIVFLDVNQFHYLISLKLQKKLNKKTELVPRRLQNQLLPCEQCRQVDGFVFGAHDFAKEIEEAKRLRAQRGIAERQAAIRIVRFYRRYLIRKYRRAVAGKKFATKLLCTQAAIRMQACARGRLGRRIYVTETHLLYIKNSHALLIKHALKIVPGEPRVFWYKRQVELDLVFSNYLELIEKTGQQPARVVVERNIALLAARIFRRQSELVIIVQKRWRGFVGRRMVKFFKTEVHRLFSYEVSQVLKIQRNFRGHYVRMYVIPYLLDEQLKDKLMQRYTTERYKQKLKQVSDKLKDHLRLSYVKERNVAHTARLLAKIPYQFDEDAPPPSLRKLIRIEPAGKRSRPTSSQMGNSARGRGERRGAGYEYHSSTYGDDLCMDRSVKVLQADLEITLHKYQVEEEDKDRREFVAQRVAERGPEGYGMRNVVSSLNAYSTEEKHNPYHFSSGSTITSANSAKKHKKESSRSHGMREYFSKDMDDITDRSLQRVLYPPAESCISALERADKKKTKVKLEIKLFNEDKEVLTKKVQVKQRKMTLRSSQISFPEHIHFDSSKWLFENDEEMC